MKAVWTVYFDSPKSPAPGKFLLLNGDYELGKTAIAHVAVPSDVQPSYAPEGRSLVVATIVGDAADSLNLNNAEAVETRAREEIRRWFPDCENWRTLDVQHINAALPLMGQERICYSQDQSMRMELSLAETTWRMQVCKGPSTQPKKQPMRSLGEFRIEGNY